MRWGKRLRGLSGHHLGGDYTPRVVEGCNAWHLLSPNYLAPGFMVVGVRKVYFDFSLLYLMLVGLSVRAQRSQCLGD